VSTTPRTWVVGEVVTAAMLNTEVRDQFADLFASWSSYSPSWTAATTNPSLGNGALTGRQKTVGKRCDVKIELTIGSTTTVGSGQYSFSVPALSSGVGSSVSVGVGHGLVGSRFDLNVLCTSNQTNLSVAGPTSTTNNTLVFIGSGGIAGTPFAAGHVIRASLTYELT
jgi:hypothetical protein